MSAVGKVIDATVLVGSGYIGYNAAKSVIDGIKLKNTTSLVIGGITLLISVYAFREAWQKINSN